MGAEFENQQDRLKIENELLKLKLGLEYGMDQSDSSSLSPETENRWLNHIYDFERHYKNARQLKVYDFIGRPDFKKLETLAENEIPAALNRLLTVMEGKGIALDCCCAYDSSVIYKFITEELFNHEMEAITIDGMVHHFIYEEFHPNHDYDLRRYAEQFIENLLKQKWNTELSTHQFAKEITFNGTLYDYDSLVNIILAFQEERTFKLQVFDIEQVEFDVETEKGKVKASIIYDAYSSLGHRCYSGPADLTFTLEFDYWVIAGFHLPGLTH